MCVCVWGRNARNIVSFGSAMPLPSAQLLLIIAHAFIYAADLGDCHFLLECASSPVAEGAECVFMRVSSIGMCACMCEHFHNRIDKFVINLTRHSRVRADFAWVTRKDGRSGCMVCFRIIFERVTTL